MYINTDRFQAVVAHDSVLVLKLVNQRLLARHDLLKRLLLQLQPVSEESVSNTGDSTIQEIDSATQPGSRPWTLGTHKQKNTARALAASRR